MTAARRCCGVSPCCSATGGRSAPFIRGRDGVVRSDAFSFAGATPRSDAFVGGFAGVTRSASRPAEEGGGAGKLLRDGAYPVPLRMPLACESGGASTTGGRRSCTSACAAFFRLGSVGALRGSTSAETATFVFGTGGSGVSGSVIGATYACAASVLVPIKSRWLDGGGGSDGVDPPGTVAPFSASPLGFTSRMVTRLARRGCILRHGARHLRAHRGLEPRMVC